MNCNITGKMKSDCRQFMRTAFVASFFHRLVNMAAPTVAAWMIGDMANHLLVLDRQAIATGMPPFLCAVFFQVVVVALLQLALNLLLTKQGFAYDGFLMEKFIRLPLRIVQTTDAGSVMERLEEDAADFFWNQMTLCTYPAAVVLYFAVFAYAMIRNNCHIIFVVTIVLLAALPVMRAAHIGKRQSELKKQVSEYNESRKQMEQELFSAREFSRSFSLDEYFIERLRNQFSVFLKRTGSEQYRMEAKTEIMNFLCSHGVQLCAVLVGAVLISFDRLTLGALLSGYLMIPAIRQCCRYVRDWVTELPNEKKCLERLKFFYSADGESNESVEVLQSLDADNISFTYPGSEASVLSSVNFHMDAHENYRIVGANGSGKTTLLSILAGLYEPQDGTVCGGASVGCRRKSVALQEQTGTIFSGTVWENLFLPKSKQRAAATLLNEMGFEKNLNYETASEGSNLSPGERKKLLLTRALLRDAPFLMLDEPLNHLDEDGKRALLTQLERRNSGLLLISHQNIDLRNSPFKDYKLYEGFNNPCKEHSLLKQ